MRKLRCQAWDRLATRAKRWGGVEPLRRTMPQGLGPRPNNNLARPGRVDAKRVSKRARVVERVEANTSARNRRACGLSARAGATVASSMGTLCSGFLGCIAHACFLVSKLLCPSSRFGVFPSNTVYRRAPEHKARRGWQRRGGAACGRKSRCKMRRGEAGRVQPYGGVSLRVVWRRNPGVTCKMV